MSFDSPQSHDLPVPTGREKPAFRAFRSNLPKLTREQAERQGRVTKLAYSIFMDRDRLRAFLNHHHDELDGRPLDVAIASDEGLAAVERLLDSQRSSAPGLPANAMDRASAAHGPAFPTD